MKKRLLTILLSITIVTGLTGCGDESTKKAEDLTLPTTKVEADKLTVEPLNLTMTMPLNWSISNQEEMELYYQLDSGALDPEKAEKQLKDGKLDFYPLIVSTFSKDMPVGTIEVWIKKTDEDLNDFIKSEQKGYQEKYTGSTFSEIKDTEIGGKEGAKMTQTIEAAGETKEYLYIQDGDYVLAFVGSSIDEAIEDLINESFKTIKFK